MRKSLHQIGVRDCVRDCRGSYTTSCGRGSAGWPAPAITRFTALRNASVAASTVSVETPRPR